MTDPLASVLFPIMTMKSDEPNGTSRLWNEENVKMNYRCDECKKSTERGQKVRIFLRTIRHLHGTKGVQLAKEFARKYLTPDQARSIFPSVDFADVDFKSVPRLPQERGDVKCEQDDPLESVPLPIIAVETQEAEQFVGGARP